MTCINETKQNKTKKKLYNYCHLYQSILVSVMPFGYNLRGSIQIVKKSLFYSDSWFTFFPIRIPCSFYRQYVHLFAVKSLATVPNLYSPDWFLQQLCFFLLCLNPYLWAQCLWATFSGFKIISSAYETTFCDWLSRPMKMIFTPKSFSKEKQN